MDRYEERQKYLKSLSDICLHVRIEKDAALILSLKSDLLLLVSCIGMSKTNAPPYLKQIAKEIKQRHLNENNTTTES